ncbi:MAG: AI-2E family transporter [Burkholderiaceae bacterium]|nr:AI-2E family transporter [Burkholderiaceae bacterium]
MQHTSDNKGSASQLNKIVGAATILALLYFGREVLIPITLALILSFLIAPLVRQFKRLGLNRTAAVSLSVLLLTLGLSAVSAVIGSQLIRTASSLPQYEDTIRGKILALDKLTLGRVNAIAGHADRVMSQLSANTGAGSPATALPTKGIDPKSSEPLLVKMQEQAPKPYQLLSSIVTSVWGPLETTSIVFVVLIFILLEHEALRDRFIRLVGPNNLRATTVAVNDAGERLSRFFVSQVAVNVAVGVLIWLCLAVAGVPQALLWGAVATTLRFVPYVGVWVAAFCATLLAAAVTPGWTLALLTMVLFGLVEVVISQVVEPRLYGHATGLSPLSVVIAAIFWSWLWGPIGLVLSTPLTLCLVVAGHYIQSLNFLEILLGEVPALTMPENLYQRVLSGDAHEITASAQQFLKKKSFGAYCDSVLMPALHLAHTDFKQNSITQSEQIKVNSAIASMLMSLEGRKNDWKSNQNLSVLADANIARQLRSHREKQLGKWQGPIKVPPGSVVLGIGLGSLANEMAAEILVRVLRSENIDARQISLDDLQDGPPPDASAELVAMICLVSVEPLNELDRFASALVGIRDRLPASKVVALSLSNPFEKTSQDHASVHGFDQTVHSFQDILGTCVKTLKVSTASDI